MAYKARFRPLEKLGPDGWSRFEPVASDRIAAMFELA
jgi:arginine-tRNA-protein transferase